MDAKKGGVKQQLTGMLSVESDQTKTAETVRSYVILFNDTSVYMCVCLCVSVYVCVCVSLSV